MQFELELKPFKKTLENLSKLFPESTNIYFEYNYPKLKIFALKGHEFYSEEFYINTGMSFKKTFWMN